MPNAYPQLPSARAEALGATKRPGGTSDTGEGGREPRTTAPVGARAGWQMAVERPGGSVALLVWHGVRSAARVTGPLDMAATVEAFW